MHTVNTKVINSQTKKALAELELGKGKRFKNVKALMKDLMRTIERSTKLKR